MGVLNLWKILQNTSQSVNIAEDLKNKTLAVDLSIWICENSNIGYYATNTKPHLRTLFFRSRTLLEIGCKLIFIREGDVISLKQDTMKKRNQNRFGESSQSSQSQSQSQSKPIKNRSRFDHVADECCELLKSMGITVIRSPCGEAEKACAFLNLIGKCDAVLTNDSDVFLYGARCVYRNFSSDKKSENIIEKYDMDIIENTLKYDREMLVVLGLLLGCDYDSKGVPGCGKEMACKFLNEISEFKQNSSKPIEIFDLLRKWSSSQTRTYSKFEDKIRKLALSHAENERKQFPNEEIITEYMSFSRVTQVILSEEKYLSIKWIKPNLKLFQIFNQNEQNWGYDYSANKLIPLIIQYEHNNSNREKRSIEPLEINKIRRKDAIEHYEVIWSKMNSNEDIDLSDLTEYITLERIELFKEKFPNLAQTYQSKIDEKKNSRKNKKKEEKIKEAEPEDHFYGMDSLMELYEDMSLIEEKQESKKNKKKEVHEQPNSQVFLAQSSKKPKSNKVKNKVNDKLPLTQISNTIEKSEIKQVPIVESTRYRLIDILELSSDDDYKPKENKRPLKLVDETIVLDSDDDSDKPTEIINQKQSAAANTDLDFVMKSFEAISIRNKPNVRDKMPKIDTQLEESFLPLSQRMKKKFNISTTSVFDK